MKIRASFSVLFLLFASHASFARAEASPLNGIESSLTVYSYPPLKTLNWSSPRSVLKSFVRIEIPRQLTMNGDIQFESPFGDRGEISSYYISTMGHAITHVRCPLPDGTLYDRWSSFSGQNYAEVDKKNLLRDEIGMGVLFYDYVDGHIISGEENRKRITHYKGRIYVDAKGIPRRVRPRYFQVEITPERCADLKTMIDFFESFHFPAGTPLRDLSSRDPEDTLYFSSQLDPFDSYIARRSRGHGRVGGGCAPYAAALLKMSGRYEEIFESSWRWRLDVSERLIGGIPDPMTGEIRRVRVKDLILTEAGGSWTFEGYRNRSVEFYDPQSIWQFIGDLSHCMEGDRDCPRRVRDWVSGKESGAVSRGEVLFFRDTYVQERVRGTDNGLETERTPYTVVQPVEGVVWRLVR